ncbi:MAG TPA: hypothetical protein VF942_12820 [Acidimicrobiales bacterium]
MTENRYAATARRGVGTHMEVLNRVLQIARSARYEGYSKHDGLNSPVLARLAGGSRLRRLGAIQVVTRSPVDIRPLVGVRKARNAKGLSLFARALLARHRITGSADDAREARELLDWLIDHPAPGFEGLCWGYPYPWQDVGFFAPRDLPNRVVTSFVGQALLDGYETLQDDRYLDAATRAVWFLLEAPKTLFEDDDRRCVSYVPDRSIDWIVMDVSALAGALAARLGAIAGDRDLIREGGRLVRYVVSKQTDYGAWFYADPPSASHITHDNYHTGFILDAILQYGLSAGSDEFDSAYRCGIEFYEQRLFEPSGAARFMNDRLYPIDIHGCAQGVITFSLQQRHLGSGATTAARVLQWTLGNMWDPASGWFYYQRRRGYRTRIRELRWCQGWMSWALASYLENCGGTEGGTA